MIQLVIIRTAKTIWALRFEILGGSHYDSRRERSLVRLCSVRFVHSGIIGGGFIMWYKEVEAIRYWM